MVTSVYGNNINQGYYPAAQYYPMQPQYYPIQPQYQPAYPMAQMPAPYAAPIAAPYAAPVITKTPTNDVFQKSNTPNNAPNDAQNNPQNKKITTPKAKLSLFFINDMHGHFDNMSNILGASKQFDKDAQNKKGVDTLKLSAGDNYTGGDVKKNNLMMNFLDYIGIEASAVGNHEYDATTTELCNANKNSKVKFLAANAIVPEGNEYYNNIQKSIIIKKDGGTYGIVGLTPFDLETVASKKDALEGVRPFNLEESAKLVQTEIDKLRAQGVNKIILLSHIGIDQDRKIIPMLDGVDIVQGGHSHNLTPKLKEGENILRSKSNEPVIMVQAGENGKYAGVLDVEFDENGIITTASMDIKDAPIEKNPVLEHIKSSVLGKSPQIGILKNIDPTPENRRIIPSAWTNLLADSMRSELNTDIAFVNSANMRKMPKAGTLTERDVTDTSPMKNKTYVSNMTEKEIVRVVKEACKVSLTHETGEPGIMHVSGLTYKATSDGDLLEMNFVDKNGNKTPIDINNPSDTKSYTVAHDSFVAEVRDNMEYPGMAISAHKNQDVKIFDFDKDKTAADYIKKLPNRNALEIKDDHRIQIIEKDGSLRTLNHH